MRSGEKNNSGSPIVSTVVSAVLSMPWYHWLFALMSFGFSLLISVPLALRKKSSNEKELSQLLAQHRLSVTDLAAPLTRVAHLLEDDAVVSSPTGVDLQEARQGDAVTKSEGEIKMRGKTETLGAGVGIGPVGVGIGFSDSRLKGSLNSTAVTTIGEDRAVAIDKGQLRLSKNGLEFVGRLQVRALPIEDLLNVSTDNFVLVVAARSMTTAQRFRFYEHLEVHLFHAVLKEAITQGKFPDLADLKGTLESLAAASIQDHVDSLERKIRQIAPATVL